MLDWSGLRSGRSKIGGRVDAGGFTSVLFDICCLLVLLSSWINRVCRMAKTARGPFAWRPRYCGLETHIPLLGAQKRRGIWLLMATNSQLLAKTCQENGQRVDLSSKSLRGRGMEDVSGFVVLMALNNYVGGTSTSVLNQA